MEKFDFTSEGASALIAALYALPDAALQQEANHVNADFAGWLISKFELEPSQIAYLAGMSATLLSFMASQISFAMRHRLKLALVKPLQRSTRDTKLIETKTKIDAGGDGDGSENAEGEVIVEISY